MPPKRKNEKQSEQSKNQTKAKRGRKATNASDGQRAAATGRERKRSVSGSPFNFVDKKNFLLALKENGLSVINDIEKLKLYLNGRSTNEIKFFIENYLRKSKEIDNSQDLDESRERLEKWYHLVQNMVSVHNKKADFSSVIPHIFEEFGNELRKQENQSDNITVKYSKVYRFLAEVLKGNFPPEIKGKEALTVLTLMSKSAEFIEKFSHDLEFDFMREGSWWQSEEIDTLPINFNSNTVNNGDIASNPLPSTSHSTQQIQDRQEAID
ncbi:hypothetical protein B4U79_14622, partial [Dinothrombium tinctorium]